MGLLAPSILPLLSSFVIAMAMLIVAYFGWRGRKIHTPPSCRKCGYDVSKRAPDSTRCSECGADLTSPTAIVEYRRRKIFFALLPSLLLAVLASLYFINVARDFNWRLWSLQYVSDAYVIRKSEGDLSVSGDLYRDEWLRRGMDKEKMLGHFVDTLLKKRDWMSFQNSPYTSILRTGLQTGTISRDLRSRIFKECLTPISVEVRNPVRVGDPLMIRVIYPDLKFVLPDELREYYAAALDGAAKFSDRNWSQSGALGKQSIFTLESGRWPQVNATPGEHDLQVAIRLQPMDRDEKPTLEERVIVHNQKVTLLPPNSQIGEGYTDEPAGKVIAANVKLAAYHWYQDHIAVFLTLAPASGDRAFDIIVVVDGKEHLIGHTAAKSGESTLHMNLSFFLKLEPGCERELDHIALVLRGSQDALPWTFDQTKYWMGEIRFENVPLCKPEEVSAFFAGEPKPTTLPAIVSPGR